MSSKGLSIEYEANVSPAEAASYLEILATGLREGHAMMEAGEKSLDLQFGPKVKLELEAEMNAEKGKGSIELSISWRPAEETQYRPTLRIETGSSPAASGEEETEIL